LGERQHAILRWTPWVALCVVICAIVIHSPERHTVLPAYRVAVERFFGAEPLYHEGIHGFLYLPAFAVFFAPFDALPTVPGEILWRVFGFALLACGVRRLCARLTPDHRRGAFLLAGVLIALGSCSAFRNGQANLWIAGLMLHAALDVCDRRTTRASCALTLALIVKPIAIVPYLLFGALERRMLPRLAIGLVFVFGLPFAFGEAGYVWAQYGGFVEKLHRSIAPGDVYVEVFGGLQHLGFDVPEGARRIVRALMALVTFGLCRRAYRREGTAVGALAVLYLSAVYLMAFNPRTEENSYVILAAVLAPTAAASWLGGRRRDGAVMAVGCFLIGTHVWRWRGHDLVRAWLKPLLALAFGAWTVLRFGSTLPAARRDAYRMS